MLCWRVSTRTFGAGIINHTVSCQKGLKDVLNFHSKAIMDWGTWSIYVIASYKKRYLRPNARLIQLLVTAELRFNDCAPLIRPHTDSELSSHSLLVIGTL
jgi:hypothetical protein